MAKILLIDSNPDQQRALCGLIRYRTPHSVAVAGSQVEGARAVVAEWPDLIMINLLMFMKSNFAFPRVLQRSGRAASIPIVVHTSGVLEDLTRRRIEGHRAAGIVEMPLSAGELTDEIEQAFQKARQPKAGGREVRSVQWEQAEGVAPDREKPIRPVDWRTHVADGREPSGPSAPQAPAQPPAFEGPGGQPISGQKRHPDADRNGEPGQFRPGDFETVDPSQAVKGGTEETRSAFRRTGWPSVDPGKVKNPSQKGGKNRS